MKLNDVKEIENIIGYDFTNKLYLEQAFTCRSYSNENENCPHNEMFELIGDRMLDLAITKIMEERLRDDSNASGEEDYYRPIIDEGKFTLIKSILVQSETLAEMIEEANLEEYLLMSNGDIKNQVYEVTSVKENLFEAIIGAISLDSNYNIETIVEVLESFYDFDQFLDTDYLSDYDAIYEVTNYSKKLCGRDPEYFYFHSYDYSYICNLEICNQNNEVLFEVDGQGFNSIYARIDACKKVLELIKDEDGDALKIVSTIEGYNYENSLIKINALKTSKLIKEVDYDCKIVTDNYYESGKKWICKLKIDNFPITNGEGSKKNDAKKEAAYLFLEDLFFNLAQNNRYEDFYDDSECFDDEKDDDIIF